MRRAIAVASLLLVVGSAASCNRGSKNEAAASADAEDCEFIWDVGDGISESLENSFECQASDKSLDQHLREAVEMHNRIGGAMSVPGLTGPKFPNGVAATIVASTPAHTCQLALSASGPRTVKWVQLQPDGTTREETVDYMAEGDEDCW